MQNWLEFQTVIMAAGKGSRIPEMTVTKPKCLLPVGNKPMIYYPLKLLESSGFKETKIIVPDSYSSDIQEEVDRLGLEMSINFVPIPSDDDWGTADSLRHIADYITTDIIVLSCDFITDTDLHEVLNLYRKHNASLVSLYFSPLQNEKHDFVIPGPKSKNKIEKDIIGYDSKTNRILLMASASDFEETMPLSKALLNKCSNIRLSSKLLDAHLYIMKRWIINYLVSDKNMSTLKGELLPFVVKKQLSKQSTYRKNSNEINHDDNDDVKTNIFTMSRESNIEYNIHSMTFLKNTINSEDLIKCYAYIMDSNIGMRANTLYDYYKINKIISKLSIDIGNEKDKISSEADILSNQLDKESCFVGPNTKIMEKTSIKNSSIGARCTINSKTRLTDCILMNGVIIEERCVLHNCIICHDAIISAGCELKDCLISGNFKVPPGGKHYNEVLTAMDRLMEI
ncbi:translation initiation factor eIF-2B subunit gamma [Daktulosphaira vitifoliae]|uniref:translation initiation factor eIF-2B subunit gamma n=1 Tax=Daktulosphaira vitifoliae TaxID=58002 RepID=UPI0021AA2FEE|nr:translation initiation factor eIF-2B subunit gamma [Daktulosphaira vitifoliae]